MPHTIKVRDASEVLSLIPFQLGFWPRNSLVAVSLRGPRSRVGLVARVDLADLAGSDGPAIAEQLMSLMQSDGAQSLVIATFSEDSAQIAGFEPSCANTSEQSSGERKDAARAVLTVVSCAQGVLPVQEAWHVDAREYSPWAVQSEAGYLDHQLDLTQTTQDSEQTTLEICGEHAHSSSELRNTVVSAHMVYEGRTMKTDRTRLAEIAPATTQTRRLATTARKELQDTMQRQTSEHDKWDVRTQVLEFWGVLVDTHATAEHKQELSSSICAALAPNCNDHEACGSDPTLCGHTLGILTQALCDTQMRDAALISATPLGIEGAKRFLECGALGDSANLKERDDIARSALSFIVDPHAGIAPNDAELSHIAKLLEDIVAASEVSFHGAPRTLLALLAWWQGNAVLARRHLEQGGESTQEYSLARLIQTALDHGLAPGWQRTDRSPS